MSKKFSASMFDTLKDAMAEQRSGGSFKDILKTSIGNNYLVRLVPNVKDISKTSYHYFSHGWKSLATGQFVSCMCPTTFGERCPICEERVRLYRGDDEDKANARLLGRKEQWYINAYVVDDPTNKENNDKVKIVRYGKQLDKVIKDATEGIDKDEFGAKVFDLSEDGCNLRITVEKNDGGYPTYVSSKFLHESEIDGMDDSAMDKVYDSLFQLDSIMEKKSPEEVGDILSTHFFCEVTKKDAQESSPAEGNETELSSSGQVVEEVKETVKETVIDADPEPENLESSMEEDAEVKNKLQELMKDL